MSGRRSANRIRPAVLSLAVLLTVVPARGSQSPQRVDFPYTDVGIETLAARAAAQLAARDEIAAFDDFGFENRQVGSGLTFRHDIVEEGKKIVVPSHYDHGSPVAAADIDGDGLIDLYFVNMIGANALYRNLGDGRFEDVTDGNLGLEERVSMAASFADADNDGDPDLFVTTVRGGNAFFENVGNGRFRDVSAESGLDYLGYSSTGTFFDYDGDGLLDLFLTNVGRFTTDEPRPQGAFRGYPDAFQGHLIPERTETSVLYRNLGGLRFTDVTRETGLIEDGWVGDALATDFDRDGDPDLYMTNMQGDDRYWENQDGSAFVERTADFFSVTPWGTMGAKFFDYDNDGDLDAILVDMHSDMSQEAPPQDETKKSEMLWNDTILQGGANNVFGNAFYRNLGDGRFEEVSDAIGAENYWPWGVTVADLNADGWQDVFITGGMGYPFRYSPNAALLNDGGRRFADATFILGIEPRPAERLKVPWFVLDCRPASVDKTHPACEGVDGLYEFYGNASTRGSAIFDLEGDGDLDIVTNEFMTHPQVLVSDLAQRTDVASVSVRLHGTRSNRDGLGAWVTVITGERRLVQYNDGATGYMAHGTLPLVFGLGDAGRIDRIEVTWPSGTTQTVVDGLTVGTTIDIEEPASR